MMFTPRNHSQRPKFWHTAATDGGKWRTAPQQLLPRLAAKEFTSVFVAMWMMDNFQRCNPSPKDETFQDVRYSIVIFSTGVPANYILGPTIPRTRYRFILISSFPFIFHLLGGSSTLWNVLPGECFSFNCNLNFFKSRVKCYLSYLSS